MSKGGHTQGTAQDESELEQKEAGVQQEDTVLAQGATPGGSSSTSLLELAVFLMMGCLFGFLACSSRMLC